MPSPSASAAAQLTFPSRSRPERHLGQVPERQVRPQLVPTADDRRAEEPGDEDHRERLGLDVERVRARGSRRCRSTPALVAPRQHDAVAGRAAVVRGPDRRRAATARTRRAGRRWCRCTAAPRRRWRSARSRSAGVSTCTAPPVVTLPSNSVRQATGDGRVREPVAVGRDIEVEDALRAVGERRCSRRRMPILTSVQGGRSLTRLASSSCVSRDPHQAAEQRAPAVERERRAPGLAAAVGTDRPQVLADVGRRARRPGVAETWRTNAICVPSLLHAGP